MSRRSPGHIRARGVGSWELRVNLPKDASGQRRVHTETLRGSLKDAQRRLRALLTELDRGTKVEAGKMSVAVWLQRWLDERRGTVSPKTWQENDGYVRHHLIPALGHMQLARLGPSDIQAYLSAAMATGRLDGRGGLAPQTVRHHERTLHAALERARRLRLIPANPCDDVVPPCVEPAPMVILDPDQQRALLAAAAAEGGRALQLPVLVALSTGLRRGELLGLAWTNVDLKAGTLCVVQVVEQTKAGVRIKPAPKTAQSRRAVALTPAVTEALRRYKTMALADGLLFPRWATNPAVFGTAFTRMARRAGIKASLHDLRHTHCSDLLHAGVHPKAVSERLGHSSVAFTIAKYGHISPAMHAQVVKAINAVLLPVVGAAPDGEIAAA